MSTGTTWLKESAIASWTVERAMYEVRITRVQDGVDRSRLVHAIHEYAKHDLVTAQACIESVLEGNDVSLWVKDHVIARIFAEKLVECGAEVHIDDGE